MRIALAFALWSLTAAPSSAGVPEISPDELAIFPWGWTRADVAVLRELKEAGFNMAGFVEPDGLDAVADAGLKAIVREHATSATAAVAAPDGDIERRVRSLTDRVGNHPAVYGYYLRDEPWADAFELLAKWSAAYRAAAPDAVPYINLFPIYAFRSPPDYERYVEQFVRVVKPPLLSYDNYSLLDDGSVRDGYFRNLEVIRNAALRFGVPFWNTILSNAHFRYAEPTQAGLTFQAFTTLAYGGRGVSYYTYFTPTRGNYRLGPIDQFGHRTPTWDMVRRTNLQLHNLAPVYAHLKSANVFHHPDVPSGCRGLRTSRFVASLDGGSLVVGEFEGPEKHPALVIVNKDLRRSTFLALRFKGAMTAQTVNTYTGQLEPFDGSAAWLGPGQGMLVLLGPAN